MHKFLMQTPKGMHTDHINGNGLDNRRSNLRVCTPSQNKMNSKTYRTNKSGFKGVSFYKRDRNWSAQITMNFKKVHLGYFSTPGLAHVAYCNAALKLHGEFANFGDGCVILKDSDAGS